MVEPRITRGAGHEFAFDAASNEAEQHLTPAHWALWSAVRCPARYELAPQADEWEPVLGFAPDQRSYMEYGYMLVDAGGTVLACRVLVDRREPGLWGFGATNDFLNSFNAQFRDNSGPLPPGQDWYSFSNNSNCFSLVPEPGTAMLLLVFGWYGVRRKTVAA